MKQKLLLASVIGLCSLSAPGLSFAFNPQPDPPAHIAMVGILPDQTIRLNVRALKLRDVPPGPCIVTLGFTDAGSRVVGKPVTRALTPGRAFYLDLPGSSLSTNASDNLQRVQLHPAVRVRSSTNPSLAACKGVAATVEVIDPTGRTSVFVEDPDEFTVEDPNEFTVEDPNQ